MDAIMGTIFNIQRYCLHDGDGIRTVVFFKGCPLRCIWCHNPEGLTADVDLSYSKDKCVGCGRCLSVCDGRNINGEKLEISREKCLRCGNCIFVLWGQMNL